MQASTHNRPSSDPAVDRLELYRDAQKGELQFREQTIGSLSPFVGILTGLVGAILFYLRNSPHRPLDAWALLFYSAVLLSGVALLTAVWFVGTALWGFEYLLPASPDSIEGWRQRELQLRAREADREITAELGLRQMLVDQFAQVASANRELNVRSSHRAFAGKVATIVSLLLLALSLIPFTVLVARDA